VADAHDMVQTCFRHQHPEAYERDEVAEPSVPTELRYGRGDAPTHTGAGDVPEYVADETGVRPVRGLPGDTGLVLEQLPDQPPPEAH
jgi:hypothetical protein